MGQASRNSGVSPVKITDVAMRSRGGRGAEEGLVQTRPNHAGFGLRRVRKRAQAGRRVAFATAALIAVTAAWYLGARVRDPPEARANPPDAASAVASQAAVRPAAVAPPTSRDWSGCAVAKKPPSVVAERVEPLWLPAYPTALPDKGYAAFLEALTGVPQAAKSYYRSSPKLRRCHYKGSDAKVQGITCEIVHRAYPVADAPRVAWDALRSHLRRPRPPPPRSQRSCSQTGPAPRASPPTLAAGSSWRCAIR